MEKVRCGPLDRRQSRSWPGGSRSAAAGPTGPAPPHPSSGQEAWGLGQGLAGPAGGARVPAWFQGPGAGPALPGEGRGKGVTGGNSGSQKCGGPGPIRGRAPRAVSEHRTRTPWRAPAASPPEPWTEPAGTAGCWRGPRRPPPAAASGRVGRAASSLCSSLFASAPLQNAKPFSARGPLRRRQQRPPRPRCWRKAESTVRACQGGELSSLPGPGCWGPFPTGTANGNAGSVSGALKPGAEPSAPVTTARLRGQRASPARRIHRPPDTRLLHRPTSEAAGSCDSQRRSGPRWRPALHPTGRPRCLWSPPPRGSRLRPPCRGWLCSAWGGSPAGTGQGRVSARWELGACRPCRCTVHAGRATWRAPDSVRSPGPALAPLPAQPPCHGDSLNHALPEHVGGQAWTALLPSASSLGITPLISSSRCSRGACPREASPARTLRFPGDGAPHWRGEVEAGRGLALGAASVPCSLSVVQAGSLVSALPRASERPCAEAFQAQPLACWRARLSPPGSGWPCGPGLRLVSPELAEPAADCQPQPVGTARSSALHPALRPSGPSQGP